MALITLLLSALSLGLLSYGQTEALEKCNSSDFQCTCNQIAGAISSASQVFYPPSTDYLSDISHYSTASTQAATCSVEPGCAEDVSKILYILASSKTPFAVKGGGHATNPGFSSTKGIQITMTRFNETTVDSTSQTVAIGAGLTWDQVFATLEPAGVTVIGARVTGVGVAGSILGGGYSFLSSQYGLSVDNVAGFELVLPNGTIQEVTSKDKDLWFGLRGGMNNFGIVTKYILNSYPQGGIWGHVRFYTEDQQESIKDALVNFQQEKDTKAEAIVFLYYSGGQFAIVGIYFYDAPTPSGVFDEFLAIPYTNEVVATTIYGMVEALGPLVADNGLNVFYEGIPVAQYSSAVFDAFADQVKSWGAQLYSLDPNVTLGATLEPFDEGLFSHGSDSAYPPDRSFAIFPTDLSVIFSKPSLADTMANALRNVSQVIHSTALKDGQNVSNAAVYPNYALYGTPLEQMYGGNVERLRAIRAAVDPNDVMGLTGGWKF